MEIDYKTKFKNILELNAQWLESDIPLGDKLRKLAAVILGSDYYIDKSHDSGFTIREHPQWTPAPPDVIKTPDDKAEQHLEKGEKQIIKDFVLSIKADIEQIDTGSKSCIDDFLLGFNPAIEKYNLKLEYSGKRTAYSTGLNLIDIAHNPVPEKTNEIIFPGKIEDLTDEIWHKAQMESLKKRGFEFFEGGLYVLDKDGKRTATITKDGYKSIK